MTNESTSMIGAAEGVRATRGGRLTPRTWVEQCCGRIDDRDRAIEAWAFVDAERALRVANEIAARLGHGRLLGLPIGVKDVIDVAGMPTGCNSPIEAGRTADDSAAAVARLMDEGAIVIGKTVTTEYAFLEPGPTRNPWDHRRTPGGSSSGSAAAVADAHVPIALTTQTGGSTIRPAAFCGIVGYKPPYGCVPSQGLVHLSPSLDVIGLHARNVTDIALVASVMEARERRVQVLEPPRYVRVHLPSEGHAEPAVHAMIERAVEKLRWAGAVVREVELPEVFKRLDAAHRVVMSVEVARSFSHSGRARDARLSASLREFIGNGLSATSEELAAAQAAVAQAKAALVPFAFAGEVLLSPAAPGEAPIGLGATGSATFNRLWSLLHVGVITVPCGLGPHGMPLGLQLGDPLPSGELLFPAAAFAEMTLAPIARTRVGEHT
jgi:Asp-tRNA(Asn)/Glu-tRNA(Gln) amidotransferase A subunit family amidase